MWNVWINPIIIQLNSKKKTQKKPNSTFKHFISSICHTGGSTVIFDESRLSVWQCCAASYGLVQVPLHGFITIVSIRLDRVCGTQRGTL